MINNILLAAQVTFIFITTSVLSLQPAKADVLGTGFTYQGNLEVSNTPANGLYDFEFALFDALTGGVETGTLIVMDDVVVTNGVFSVELDFGVGPFMGDQTWIDIAVRDGMSTSGFTGLLPRQKLTATPYALHAEMVAADAIGAAELATNSVGASEISSNAVGTSEIITSQVQQRVTGSCSAGNFTTAVNQNGTMTCSADQIGIDASGAVAAVLAADGSGSGLDADLLDGQDVTQLVESSRIGTAIDSVPFTITQAGRYYFTDNLTYSGSSGAAINVNTNYVTIDMHGFSLIGTGQTGNTADGIFVLSGRDGLKVMNGTIRDFGSQGIVSSSSFSDGNQVDRVRVVSVGGEGIWLSGRGNLIVDSVVVDTGGFASIRFGTGVIRGTTVINASGRGISAGTSGAVIIDTIVTNATGTPISNSAGVTERTIIN